MLVVANNSICKDKIDNVKDIKNKIIDQRKLKFYQK